MARPGATCLFVWLAVLALLLEGAVSSPEEDMEDGEAGEDYSYGEGEPGEGGEGSKGVEDDGASDARTPSAVYVMEHGFLLGESPEWQPRGTLLLSGAPGRGGFEARLSDAKEFVQLRTQLQPLMLEAAAKNRYYSVRMYSPESPRRVLQASIPAKLLADHFEDWHDILEVTVGSTGVPVGLSYRVRHTLGLALFDHTQVHLAEPSRTEGPRVPPGTRDGDSGPGAAGDKQPGPQSLLRRYWWVIIIVLLLLTTAAEEPSAGKAGGGGGGGGGRRA
mmetsp:Transcript_77223/g.179098  ORF Transcript_77223/g.179098 Transcript_77223/m.179098 type:complete len:276 (-) Transcript_77223:100-927(-)